MHLARTSPAVLALSALAACLAPGLAAGHGVEAQVDQRDGAVSVRLLHHGGRPLADVRYEVRAPGGAAAWAEGRTDRHGWVAFTPDVPGRWTVRVVDAGGHGKVVQVDVADVAPAAAPSQDAPPGPVISAATPERAAPEPTAARADPPGGTGPLRALAGVGAIAAAFAVLFAVQRARRARGG